MLCFICLCFPFASTTEQGRLILYKEKDPHTQRERERGERDRERESSFLLEKRLDLSVQRLGKKRFDLFHGWYDLIVIQKDCFFHDMIVVFYV